ncbi:hypothetical protein D3C83_326530 [compost metagenome]
MLSTGRMYQKNETSSPRLVLLIMSSTLVVPPSIARLMFGVVPVGSFFCRFAQKRS